VNRKFLLLFFILATVFLQVSPLVAQSPTSIVDEFAFKYEWNLFTLDFGLGISDKTSKSSLDFSLNLVSVYFMEAITNIGIEINPIQYIFIGYMGDTKAHLLSFGQFTLFWNIGRLIGSYKYIFGPFVRFDFFNFNLYEFKFDLNKKIYTAGIQWTSDRYYPFRPWGIELGYRNFDNKSSVYIRIKLSPLLPAFAMSS
jgi:hypothetical protein